MIPIRDDNPTYHKPVLTIITIALCVLVFGWQSIGTEVEQTARLFRYATVPFNVTHSDDQALLLVDKFGNPEFMPKSRYDAMPKVAERTIEPVRGRRPLREPFSAANVVLVVVQAAAPWLTLLTAMFMHGGLMHLLGNMWYLWIFGNNIEDAMGKVRFAIFYLGTGLVAGIAHIISSPESCIPCIGASGAISGVLGAYLVLYPKAHVHTVVPLGYFWQSFAIPAIFFLPIWILLQFSGLLTSSSTGGGVAYWAHIGGFVAGLVLVKVFESREHRERVKHGDYSPEHRHTPRYPFSPPRDPWTR